MDVLELIGVKQPQPQTSTAFDLFGFLSGMSAPSMKDKDTLQAYTGWVYSCVKAISENVANMEFGLFRKSGSKTIEITEHIALDLLYNVNPIMTSSDLLIHTQSYLELNGNAFWYLPRGVSSKKPAEIWVLDPTNMWIVKDPRTFIKGYLYTTQAGKKVPLETTDVIHFKTFNPVDPYRGIGTVMAAALAIDIDRYSQIYNKNFFFNSAVPSAALETAGTLTTEQFGRLKAEWDSRYKGLDNAHKLAILEGGLTYKTISPTAREMQFLEQRRFSRDEILGIFRVPKTILGIVEDVNRSNAEASEYVFAKRVIEPRMAFIIDRLNEFYLPMFGDESLFFQFSSPVPEDEQSELAENTASANKWRTINEIRADEGLDPVKNGDGLYVDFNAVPLGTATEQTTTPVKTKSTDGEIVDMIAKRRNFLETQAKKKTPIFIELYKDLGNAVFTGLSEEKSIVPIDKSKVDDLLRVAMGGAFEKVIRRFGAEIKDTVTDSFLKGGLEAVLRIDPKGTFDLHNPRAESWLSDNALASAKLVEETNRDKVKDLLLKGIDDGKSVDDMAREIRDYYGDGSQWQAERLVRTENSTGFNEGNIEGFAQMEVPYKRWVLDPNYIPSVDDDCIDNVKDGDIPLDEEFSTGHRAPPVHPNCECVIIGIGYDDKKSRRYQLMMESAKKEIQEIVSESAKDILIVKQRAQDESKNIIEIALQESKKIIDEARNEKKELTGELEKLRDSALDIIYGTENKPDAES